MFVQVNSPKLESSAHPKNAETPRISPHRIPRAFYPAFTSNALQLAFKMAAIDTPHHRNKNNKICFLSPLSSRTWLRVSPDMALISLCMLLRNGPGIVCTADIFIDLVNTRMLTGARDMKCFVVPGRD